MDTGVFLCPNHDDRKAELGITLRPSRLSQCGILFFHPLMPLYPILNIEYKHPDMFSVVLYHNTSCVCHLLRETKLAEQNICEKHVFTRWYGFLRLYGYHEESAGELWIAL